MRIIFIAYKLNFGGGGGSTIEMDSKARALLSAGHSVSVVTLASQYNFLAGERPYQVYEEHLVATDFFSLQRGAVRVLRAYEAKADIFHLEGHFGYGGGWYRMTGGRAKTVVHFNRELSSFPEYTRAAYRPRLPSPKHLVRFYAERIFGVPLINKNNRLTFTSPLLADAFARFGLRRSLMTVAPDFPSSSEVVPGEEDQQRILSLRRESRSPLTLLSGGRMVKEKGFDVILAAVARLPATCPYFLHLTGDGPEREALQDQAVRLGISERVKFLGWLTKEQLREEYQRADLFIVPRWRPELTSMLVLEAAAYGLPQIVTANSAIAWQAGDQVLVFDDEDSEALARQILRYALDSESRVGAVRSGFKRLSELSAAESLKVLNEVFLKA